jgi:hypothetical protein
MAKKPSLTLVDPQQTAVATLVSPPSNLGKAGRTLWQSIMTEYDIRDSGGQQMLLQICEAADRVQEFSTIIKRDGPVIRTKMRPKDHPLLKHEQAARSFIIRSLGRLGLDVEPLKAIGRPTQPNAWTPPDVEQ